MNSELNNSSTEQGFHPHVPSAGVREHYQGCLLGGAIGDALGAPIEFMRLAEIREKFGANGLTDMAPMSGKLGIITDDTQMTLFTAEGLLRAYVRSNTKGLCHPPSVIHYAYLRWLHTQGVLPGHLAKIQPDGWLISHRELFSARAPGQTCINVLRETRGIGHPAHNNSKGCGGVMRVAPVGMFYLALNQKNNTAKTSNYKQAFDMACDAAALTHGHPTGILSAGVMAALVFDLLDKHSLNISIDRALTLLMEYPDHQETLAAVEKARQLAETSMTAETAILKLGEGWVAEEALAIGLYCAIKAINFEEGVLMAVNHDGDSDSTGLITGHLLGAIFGLSAIPQQWLQQLELRSVMEEMANDLATVSQWSLGDYTTTDDGEEEFYYQRYPGA